MTKTQAIADLGDPTPILVSCLKRRGYPLGKETRFYDTAVDGLMTALRNFDPTQGMKLSNWIWNNVDWALRRVGPEPGYAPHRIEREASSSFPLGDMPEELWTVIHHRLTRKQRHVLGMLYRLKWTNIQAAKYLGRDPKTVNRIHRQAICVISPVLKKYAKGERVRGNRYKPHWSSPRSHRMGTTFHLYRNREHWCIAEGCAAHAYRAGLCTVHHGLMARAQKRLRKEQRKGSMLCAA